MLAHLTHGQCSLVHFTGLWNLSRLNFVQIEIEDWWVCPNILKRDFLFFFFFQLAQNVNDTIDECLFPMNDEDKVSSYLYQNVFAVWMP